MEAGVAGRAPRMTAVLRDKETVTPLEPVTWGDFAAFLEYGQSYE